MSVPKIYQKQDEGDPRAGRRFADHGEAFCLVTVVPMGSKIMFVTMFMTRGLQLH